MRNLSKSKLIAFRQCQKRLWLEVHRPEIAEDSAETQAKFRSGHEVGDIARGLYDPKGKGTLINAQAEGFDAAFARSLELLATRQPLFEAGFVADGALAFADVLLPKANSTWRMVEVKSSTSVKNYHLDDIAVQAHVARTAGVQLSSIALAHIDSSWTYPGGGNYDGLLVEQDLTREAFARTDEVRNWIKAAQEVVALEAEPAIRSGKHCSEPFDCGFLSYCRAQEPQAEHPVRWLPRVASKALKSHLSDGAIMELRDVPDELLNEIQRRVKTSTLSGTVYFDATGAQKDLAPHKLPATFLDFETLQFAVPIWKGTRPYQQIPFQFSAHRLSRTEKLTQQEFLDVSASDPSRRFAEALIVACGSNAPIFVYHAAFEKSRIGELAQRYPGLRASLLALNDRIVDLLPIAASRYYHPSQEGSWSIKKVLPAVAPDLSYDDLEGVNHGGMVMEAFLEATHPDTGPERREQIRKQLLAYCRLDTYAMVRLWAFFAGRPAPDDPRTCVAS